MLYIHQTFFTLSLTTLLLVSGCVETELICLDGWQLDPNDSDRCIPIADAGTDATPGDTGTDTGDTDTGTEDVPVDAGPCPDGCSDPTPMCDTENNRCVACLLDSDCGTAAAAKCGDDGMCTTCDDSMQCMGITGTEVCAMAGDRMGECVECREDELDACDADTSCSALTDTCTGTELGMTDTCAACESDAECESDHRCVPVNDAEDAFAGFYCLEVQAGSCPRPYTNIFSDRATVSGVEGMAFCGIFEGLASCEAVAAFSNSPALLCPVGDECVGGGICRNVGGTDRCTYECGESEQCPAGRDCDNGEPPMGVNYCGG